MKKENQGFTLIELLLVIAIIGVLAGTIILGLTSQRDKARRSSALQTARSTVPALMECYMHGKSINAPADTSAGEGLLCDGNLSVWPSLANSTCTWPSTALGNGTSLIINCGTTAGNITCDLTTSACN